MARGLGMFKRLPRARLSPQKQKRKVKTMQIKITMDGPDGGPLTVTMIRNQESHNPWNVRLDWAELKHDMTLTDTQAAATVALAVGLDSSQCPHASAIEAGCYAAIVG